MKKRSENISAILLISLIFAVVYFAMRLVNLTTLPIFTDEAIYIRWAQIAEQDAAWRFISLTDGKQPLLIWFMMLSVKLFDDPLFAGRVVSVVAGFFGMVGIGLLGRELFKNTKIGIYSSLLYLISPFAMVYDRMALMDTMVSAFSVWSLYIAVLLVRLLRLDVAFVLGLSLGGGVLTKTSGFLSIYLLPATLLLFNFKSPDVKKRLLRWSILALVAVVFSQIYYTVLRLSPWFHMIAVKDTTFLNTFSEQGGSLVQLIEYTSKFFMGNLNGLTDWAIGYLTIPIVVLVFIALLFFHHNWREKLLLVIWFLAPFTGLALFGKVLYPRFIFFMILPLLILAAWSIWYLLKRLSFNTLYSVIFILAVSMYPLYVDSKLLFSVVTAPIPKADSGQYINDHPAGWGVREINDFLEREAKTQAIAVYTEGTFGLLPYGIEIELVDNPNIQIIGLWPISSRLTDEMKQSIAEKPTYYVSNKEQELSRNWDGELIASYQKGNNPHSYLKLYKLLGEKEVLF